MSWPRAGALCLLACLFVMARLSLAEQDYWARQAQVRLDLACRAEYFAANTVAVPVSRSQGGPRPRSGTLHVGGDWLQGEGESRRPTDEPLALPPPADRPHGVHP